MTNGRAVLLALILIGLPLATWAQSVTKGVTAYKAGNYAVALKEWRPLAEHGNAKAQFYLGLMYEAGSGVPSDMAKAAHWYRLAAKQGYGPAQYILGLMYKIGIGVQKDKAKAVHWYRLAAKQGIAKAQYDLGLMYYQGLGVQKDKVTAYMWLSLGAADGSKDAAVFKKNILAAQMTSADLSEAQKRAHVCLQSDYKNCGH